MTKGIYHYGEKEWGQQISLSQTSPLIIIEKFAEKRHPRIHFLHLLLSFFFLHDSRKDPLTLSYAFSKSSLMTKTSSYSCSHKLFWPLRGWHQWFVYPLWTPFRFHLWLKVRFSESFGQHFSNNLIQSRDEANGFVINNPPFVHLTS